MFLCQEAYASIDEALATDPDEHPCNARVHQTFDEYLPLMCKDPKAGKNLNPRVSHTTFETRPIRRMDRITSSLSSQRAFQNKNLRYQS